MPPLARRYLKTAIVFLVLGLLLGLHVGAAEYGGWGTLRQPYIVAHTHVLLVGFLLLLIMGVALWMFPRLPAAAGPGGEGPAALAWWLVSAGVVARACGEITSAYWPSHTLGVATFTASVVETLGVIVYFTALWPRIRSSRADR